MSNIKDIYGLTPAQEGMYYQYRMDPTSKTYHLFFLFGIGKETDLEKLSQSVELLAYRHEVLNTAFAVSQSTGSIKQVVLNNRKPDFLIQNIHSEFSSAELEKLTAEIENEPFDLQKSSLFRVRIMNFVDEKFMAIHAHHIILDGWSIPILLRDMERFYRALIKGVSFPELLKTIQEEVKKSAAFSSYITTVANQDKAQFLDYWKNLLEDYQPAYLFNNYTQQENAVLQRETAEISAKDILPAIKKYAMAHRLSLNTVFESAFGLLLQRYSETNDVIFCKPISGRNVPIKEIEKAVGPFINTVIARVSSKPDQTVEDLMATVQNQSVLTNNFGFLPLSDLLGKCKLSRNCADILFAFENYNIYDPEEILSTTLALKPISIHEQTEFSIAVSVYQTESDFRIKAIYKTERFSEKQISDLLESYIYILQQITDSKADYLYNIKTTNNKDISAISESETSVLIGKTVKLDPDATLYSLFKNYAYANSDKICILDDDKNMTFKEFVRLAEALDSVIRKRQGNKKQIIGVYTDRSLEMYLSVYAIIRGGNAYMPIDTAQPAKRTEYMIDNSHVALVLGQGQYRESIHNAEFLDVTAFLQQEADNFSVLPAAAKADDAAYVIYTSGTTGNPKGAMISHRSIVNRINWMHRRYPVNDESVILQKTPYTFDVSVWELFWWGLFGGKLAYSKPNEHFLPAKILDEIIQHRVTHIHFVPAVFSAFLDYIEKNQIAINDLSSLKHIFLSGEALSAALVDRFYQIFGDTEIGLHNLYGPTECAVDVTYYDCKNTSESVIPIGKPIDNTEIYLMDKYMNPVPVGAIGEIYIGGINVGMGYINSPEQTKNAFIENSPTSSRLYKTGDLAYIDENGQIIFCGRNDFQVKINGQRIEIDEIEYAIASAEGISAAAVLLKKVNGNDHLIAFYTGTEYDTNELERHCSENLPRYMIPSAFVHIDKIPVNQNGKTDKKLLDSFEVRIEEAPASKDSIPRNQTEKMICEAFSDLLGVDEINRDTDFINAGGSSIDIIRFVSDKRFDRITVKEFVSAPTPAGIAKLLQRKNRPALKYLSALKYSEQADKAVVIFPFAGGSAASFANLAEKIYTDSDASVYFVDFLHSKKECDAVANEIAELSKISDIVLYGHCVGAMLAINIASLVESKGASIKGIISAAYIPSTKKSNVNPWNFVHSSVISHILSKAGANFHSLPKETVNTMIQHFKKDTDFTSMCPLPMAAKVHAPTKVLLADNDIFTRSYKEPLKNYSAVLHDVLSIDSFRSDSHYFQTEKTDLIVKSIKSVFER